MTELLGRLKVGASLSLSALALASFLSLSTFLLFSTASELELLLSRFWLLPNLKSSFFYPVINKQSFQKNVYSFYINIFEMMFSEILGATI